MSSKSKIYKKDRLLTKQGFTLLESLVAIAIVLIAVSTSFTIIPRGQTAIRHIRNGITAAYLAQEALEVVRNHRDRYMYFNLEGEYPYKADWKAKKIPSRVPYNECITEVGETNIRQCMVNSFEGTQNLSPNGNEFILKDQFIKCEGGRNSGDLFDTGCDPLQSVEKELGGQNTIIYGNGFDRTENPKNEIYTRWVEIKAIPNETAGRWERDATANSTVADAEIVKDDVEMRVTAYVIWKDKGGEKRSFSLSEDLFYYLRPSDHGKAQ